MVRDIEHARLLHRAADPRHALPSRDPLQLCAKEEVLGRTHLRVERRRFGHVADGLTSLERIAHDVVPCDHHRPFRRPEEAGQDAERRALSRAVGAEKADHVSLADLERHVVHCDARAIPLDQVRDGDHEAKEPCR
jgi:hypothetical protein